jgi:lipopolysaccharide exporter
MSTKSPASQLVNAPLGYRTVGGATWGVAQTLLAKALQFASLLTLASFVSAEEFGAAAIAISISTFAPVLNPTALGDYLVQRSRVSGGFNRGIVRSGFASGIAGAVMMSSLAPVVAQFYGSSTVLEPLLFIAWKPLVDMLAVVPQSRLRSELRFKLIALIDSAVLLVTTTVSIALAFAGFGAISIVVPLVLASAQRAAVYSLAIARRVGGSPECVREGAPITDGTGSPMILSVLVVAAAQYVHTALNVVDWTLVGWLLSPTAAGLYYFAWNLSIQGNAVLASQLGQTLQPILGQLADEPKRMAYGYIRSLRLLAGVAIPISLFQAAVSGPLFDLLFGDKWDGARGVFIVLSFGQAAAFAVGPTLAVFKAQGRWKLLLATQMAQLVFVIGAVLLPSIIQGGPGDSDRQVIWIASVSAIQHFLFCPLGAWLAVRPTGARVRGLFLAFHVPLLAAFPGALGAFFVCEVVDPASTFGQLLLVAGAAALVLCSYAAIVWAIDFTLWAELTSLGKSLSRRTAAFIRRNVGQAVSADQTSATDSK